MGEEIEGEVVPEVDRVVEEAEDAVAEVGGGLMMARRADERRISLMRISWVEI